MEREHKWSLEAVVAEVRADVRHLTTDVAGLRQEFRHDIRRLDARLFQLLLTQIATLATALGALVATVAS